MQRYLKGPIHVSGKKGVQKKGGRAAAAEKKGRGRPADTPPKLPSPEQPGKRAVRAGRRRVDEETLPSGEQIQKGRRRRSNDPDSPHGTRQTGRENAGTFDRGLDPHPRGGKAGTTGTTRLPKQKPKTRPTAGAARGYLAVDGEVLGQVPRSRLPKEPLGTGPYGQAIEGPLEEILTQRFPDTRFEFRTGKGKSGVDVEWVGGMDPGFHIADFKPDTESGWSKFRVQMRRIWTGGGKMSEAGKPWKVAYLAYQPDGTLFVGGIFKVFP